jgi:hypothetical protein
MLGVFRVPRFSPDAHEYDLSNGKPEIVLVIFRHFSDNGRKADGRGRTERIVR